MTYTTQDSFRLVRKMIKDYCEDLDVEERYLSDEDYKAVLNMLADEMMNLLNNPSDNWIKQTLEELEANK